MNRTTSEPLLHEEKRDLAVLGTSLNALYQAATCHRKCCGGEHILETFAARIYNLASAAYSLISVGLYDESLVLVRSIGEIGNLLSLSVSDKPSFVKWLRSNKRARMAEFSPAKIRTLVEKSGVVLMNRSWYSELCEAYTHITPDTKPNNYNEESRNVCGNMVQKSGVEKSIDQLTSIVSMISLFYCKYFDFDDLFEEIVREAKLES